jgi:bifunctional non-homologous end joining protein LigD
MGLACFSEFWCPQPRVRQSKSGGAARPCGHWPADQAGQRLEPSYPLIVEAVNHLTVTTCLIDGEAVACDDNGMAVFERLVASAACLPLRPRAAGAERQGLEARAHRVRKATLASVLRGYLPGLRLNEHLTYPGEIVFRHACKLGLEGIVSKRLGSRYRSGRSPDWLKFKNPAAPAVKREAEEDWGEKGWQ